MSWTRPELRALERPRLECRQPPFLRFRHRDSRTQETAETRSDGHRMFSSWRLDYKQRVKKIGARFDDRDNETTQPASGAKAAILYDDLVSLVEVKQLLASVPLEGGDAANG